MSILEEWDDRDTAMVCLTLIGLACVLSLMGVPVEMLKDVLSAMAPILTAIVGALAGVATGKKKEEVLLSLMR